MSAAAHFAAVALPGAVCGAADVWPYSLFKAEVLIGFRDICERGEKIPGMPNIELENAWKQERKYHLSMWKCMKKFSKTFPAYTKL